MWIMFFLAFGTLTSDVLWLCVYCMLQPASGTNALPVQLDSKGRVKYDALVKQGHGKDKVTKDKVPGEISVRDNIIFTCTPPSNSLTPEND